MPRYRKEDKKPKKIDNKFVSTTLKLGYNALNNLEGFREWCSESFFDVTKIASLDLSFNCFGDIPSVRGGICH